MGGEQPDRVIVGRVRGLFGVGGWLRVQSHTEPTDNILSYNPWQLGLGENWVDATVDEGRLHGKGVVAKLSVCADRDRARRFIDADVAIARDQLPTTAKDEFYWSDLIGLLVATQAGVELGKVDHLIETGANDVLVVRGEEEVLIPFIWGSVVTDVDLQGGRLTVDWDPTY